MITQNDSISSGEHIIIGRTAIMALPMKRLNLDDTLDKFKWLLEGTPKDICTLNGGTGHSPRLLHFIGQTTYLAAKMAHKSTSSSMVITLAAEELLDQINHFRQRSEISEGPKSTQHLLDTCVLNDEGFVETAVEMTELGGEAWVLTLQIYALCRLFR